MLKEFKDFIITGNVIEFAVAVIMAAATAAVVNGFVADIVMPIVGQLTGGSAFIDLHYSLDGQTYETLADAREAAAPVIAYGNWIDSIVKLIVIGFVMFLIVKAYNNMKKKEEAAPTAGPSTEALLSEILDVLKK